MSPLGTCRNPDVAEQREHPSGPLSETRMEGGTISASIIRYAALSDRAINSVAGKHRGLEIEAAAVNELIHRSIDDGLTPIGRALGTIGRSCGLRCPGRDDPLASPAIGRFHQGLRLSRCGIGSVVWHGQFMTDQSVIVNGINK